MQDTAPEVHEPVRVRADTELRVEEEGTWGGREEVEKDWSLKAITVYTVNHYTSKHIKFRGK